MSIIVVLYLWYLGYSRCDRAALLCTESLDSYVQVPKCTAYSVLTRLSYILIVSQRTVFRWILTPAIVSFIADFV